VTAVTRRTRRRVVLIVRRRRKLSSKRRGSRRGTEGESHDPSIVYLRHLLFVMLRWQMRIAARQDGLAKVPAMPIVSRETDARVVKLI
jgi:hypothetical protein